jgi:hypothetical protein
MSPAGKAAIFWLPLAAWFLVIYQISDTPITYLPRFEIPYADKLVHGAIYFVLGALLVRAMDRGSSGTIGACRKGIDDHDSVKYLADFRE